VTAILLPGLLTRLQHDAPGIDLAARNLAGQFEPALAELDQRTLDVALVPMPQVPVRFMTRTLFDVEDFVIVRRVGHPIGRKVTLAKYCAAAHVVVSHSGDPDGLVNRALAKRGLTRRVALTVSSFMHALAMVAETDLLGAMPRRFVAMYGERYKVIACETPVPLASEPILAVAPQAAASDSGLVWLLDLLEKVAKSG
jgi:DNA-binding transcriptional LysR family regulator